MEKQKEYLIGIVIWCLWALIYLLNYSKEVRELINPSGMYYRAPEQDLFALFIFLIWIISWILTCIIVARYWSSKNLPPVTSFLLSLFFSPITGILLGIIFNPRKED